MVVREPAGSATAKVAAQECHTDTTTLPKDIFDTLVDALAEALVADYQQDTTRMVTSPRRSDHTERTSVASVSSSR